MMDPNLTIESEARYTYSKETKRPGLYNRNNIAKAIYCEFINDKPDSKPDDDPDSKPDSKPGDDPDSKPGDKPGGKPGGRPKKKIVNPLLESDLKSCKDYVKKMMTTNYSKVIDPHGLLSVNKELLYEYSFLFKHNPVEKYGDVNIERDAPLFFDCIKKGH